MSEQMTDDHDPTDGPNPMLEDEPVVRLFERHQRAPRLLVILADSTGHRGHTVSDLVEMSGANKDTVYDTLDALAELDLVVQDGMAGNAQLWRLKTEAEPAQAWIHLYDALGATVTEE